MQVHRLELQVLSLEEQLTAVTPVVNEVNGPLRAALKKLFPEPASTLSLDIRIDATHSTSLVMKLSDDPEVRVSVPRHVASDAAMQRCSDARIALWIGSLDVAASRTCLHRTSLAPLRRSTGWTM